MDLPHQGGGKDTPSHQRFLAMETIENGSTSYSSASAALTLLSNGVGSQASQNLFLSLLS